MCSSDGFDPSDCTARDRRNLLFYPWRSRWKGRRIDPPCQSRKIETETADDFVLQQTTIINKATIKGLLPADTDLTKINDVEVEIYHVFPFDSAPASGHEPSRTNSPSDVEIGTATRDANSGTLKLPCWRENTASRCAILTGRKLGCPFSPTILTRSTNEDGWIES